MNDVCRTTVAALVVAVVATGCATTTDSPAALAADTQGDPAIEQLPADIDVLTRVPLDDLGEPSAEAVLATETFDPHRGPYEPEEQPIPRWMEARDDVNAPPMAGEQLDVDDWLTWPQSTREAGARMLLRHFMVSGPTDSPLERLRTSAENLDDRPLPPLDIDELTGPAWVGHTVDDGTRQLFDHADPGALVEATEASPWIPHVLTTIAVPTTQPETEALRLQAFCDDYFRRCVRVLDIRATDEVLVIDIAADVPDLFEDVDVLQKRYIDGETPLAHIPDDDRGLLDRLGEDLPTAALATFLAGDGSGHYATIDGMRRVATAGLLTEFHREVTSFDEVISTTMMSLRTRLFGDLPPRHHDLAVLESITDDGLALDVLSSRTEAADPSSMNRSSLPAPRMADERPVWVSWRFEVPDLLSLGPSSAWEIGGESVDDYAMWLPGLLLARYSRPAGLSPAGLVSEFEPGDTFDDIRRATPSEARPVIGAIRQVADGLFDELSPTARAAAIPDSVGLVVTEAILEDATLRPRVYDEENLRPAAAVELYYDDAGDELYELQRLLERAATRGYVSRDSHGLDAAVDFHDDGGATIRVGINLTIDQFSGDTVEGPAGVQINWRHFDGEFANQFRRGFVEAMPGLLPPETVRWTGADTDSMTRNRFRAGAADFEPTGLPAAVDADPVAVDDASRCIAAAQGILATSARADAPVDTDALRRGTDQLRDCAADHPDRADRLEDAADRWEELVE